jgi:hypothetical protein
VVSTPIRRTACTLFWLPSQGPGQRPMEATPALDADGVKYLAGARDLSGRQA